MCDGGGSVGLGGRGHQRWLQHKTAGSGHGVAGLNLPPGNPFRGQVCLLKESQSSRFGVAFFLERRPSKTFQKLTISFG